MRLFCSVAAGPRFSDHCSALSPVMLDRLVRAAAVSGSDPGRFSLHRLTTFPEQLLGVRETADPVVGVRQVQARPQRVGVVSAENPDVLGARLLV